SFIESFGLVLIEAMALGKPLVATAVGGPLEIVEDGVSGLLVPPRDPERLANAIDQLLTDSILRSRLSHQAAERAKNFSEELMAKCFTQLRRNGITNETFSTNRS